MVKVETCLFIVKVNDEDTLVKCEGAYVSELNQLYLKLKMPNGSHMNYYVCGLNDEDKFKISLN
jgi:hypothetical protein